MCKCVEALATPMEIPGAKYLVRFLDSGHILNLAEGDTEGEMKPILRAMKEGKDGRLIYTPHWMPVKFCPACGAEVEAWKRKQEEPA